jgi:threonine/homoserine/homoserine lactone efflux protein
VTESLITISIVGLVAGFIFSMPVAGPISILVTSNALKGRLRYANLVTIGASFADFVYVFIAVYGLTRLYALYKPYIPYILFFGAAFIIYQGYKIYKTNFDIEHLSDSDALKGKIKEGHGGFFTGFAISFLNPTLFIGWMSSSFFVITLVASLGFNMGGLEEKVNENINQLSRIEGRNLKLRDSLALIKYDTVSAEKKEEAAKEREQHPTNFSLYMSMLYAFFLSIGSIIWFYYLALFLARFRHRIRVKVVLRIIKSLGIALCLLGVILGYKGFHMLL